MSATLPPAVLAEISRRREAHEEWVRAFLDGALTALGVGKVRSVDLDSGAIVLETGEPADDDNVMA